MSTFTDAVKRETLHELKVLIACLSDDTLKRIYRDLSQWSGPMPYMALEAMRRWDEDRNYGGQLELEADELEATP